MAKEKKEQEGKPEGEEKQIPEPPKRRVTDIKLLPLIGIIGGSIFFMILFIFALYWFFIRPDIIGAKVGGSDSSSVEQVESKPILSKEEEEKLRQHREEEIMAELDAVGDIDGVLFYQTQDIITNTTPPDWFLVLQLGLEYRVSDPKTMSGELTDKMKAEISAHITRKLGSLSIDEISKRKEKLDEELLEDMKPIFTKYKMFLRKVSIPKFITQRS